MIRAVIAIGRCTDHLLKNMTGALRYFTLTARSSEPLFTKV